MIPDDATIPLTADRTPIPADAEHGDISHDIADLGLPPEYENILRGRDA